MNIIWFDFKRIRKYTSVMHLGSFYLAVFATDFDANLQISIRAVFEKYAYWVVDVLSG
jgi:hypothetical protein